MDEEINSLRWVETTKEVFEKPRKIGEFVEAKYRVLADLQGVFVVAYFFILTLMFPLEYPLFKISFPLFESIFLPLLLSLPWLIIYYLGLNRWAKTFKLLDIILSRIGSYYRVFYVVNALIIIFFFVLPVLTPFLSLIALFYLIAKAVSYLPRKVVKFISIVILFTLYLMFIVFFYEDFILIYFSFIIENIIPTMLETWGTNLYSIYIFSLILASSSSLASFIRFIYEGAAQIDPTIKIPSRRIQIVQFVYLTALSVAHFYANIQIVIFALSVTALSILEALLRKAKKLYPEEPLMGEVGRWVSWVVYGSFFVIELLRKYLSYSPFLQILPIGLSSFFFLLVLTYSFIKAG